MQIEFPIVSNSLAGPLIGTTASGVPSARHSCDHRDGRKDVQPARSMTGYHTGPPSARSSSTQTSNATPFSSLALMPCAVPTPCTRPALASADPDLIAVSDKRLQADTISTELRVTRRTFPPHDLLSRHSRLPSRRTPPASYLEQQHETPDTQR